MKKYELLSLDGEILMDNDDHAMFSAYIGINYPLGDFIGISDVSDYTTIYFENYNIIINKGLNPLFFIKNNYTQIF